MTWNHDTVGGHRSTVRHWLEAGGLLVDVRTLVVVSCRSGGRSARAAALLRSRGFQHVHDLGAMTNVRV